MQDKVLFDNFGVLIDCSRNSVLNVKSVKKLIDLLSIMGYNSLQLYTEDTYEVNNEPYFGLLRGRYTKNELKEIDAYALNKGVELIPCIQTLAHLNQIFHWPIYAEICDCNDVLLVDDERTYTLIDNMFSSIAECFSSRRVNIGMDEALSLGLGKYLLKHGYKNRSEIMLKHLKRVVEIADKYGFRCSMWSDMFYRLAFGDDYDLKKDYVVSEEILKMIPKNINLICWDYYSLDEENYSNFIKQTKKFSDKVSFAGGAWTWIGLVPNNKYTVAELKAAFSACAKHDIKEVFITSWGDNGGSCSPFAVLPALFTASEFRKGNFDEKNIKDKFEKLVGVPFEIFSYVDLPNVLSDEQSNEPCNPSKYLFYNDVFLGRLDSLIDEGVGEIYNSHTTKLKVAESYKEWKFLFKPLRLLCEIMFYKADLGIKTRKAYKDKNKEEIKRLLENVFKPLLKKINEFYKALSVYWETVFKPHGFDVMDYRLGGVMLRLKHVIERLKKFADGKIDDISELNEELLDLFGNGKDLQKKTLYGIEFTANVTINRL